MKRHKKKAKQPASHKKLAAALATNLQELVKAQDGSFEERQKQCQIVTNMCYSMADSLDNLIDEMTDKCKSINEQYKFEEKRYWLMIQQGVRGIRRLIDKSRADIAEAYANEADIVSLLHKMMYDRCTTDKMWYQLYLILKALPSRMGYKPSEREERMAFMQLTENSKLMARLQLENNLPKLFKQAGG